MLADDGLDEAVAALRAFALIHREKIADAHDPAIATDSIRLHLLVRQVAACCGARDEAREDILRALLQALATVYPPDVDDDIKAWTRARRLDGLALAAVGGNAEPPLGTELQASHLLNELARFRQSVLGAYASARPLFERAVAIRERAFGVEHPDTAISLNHLARLLLDQGDLTAARLLSERALAIRERVFGLEHPETARSLTISVAYFRPKVISRQRFRF